LILLAVAPAFIGYASRTKAEAEPTEAVSEVTHDAKTLPPHNPTMASLGKLPSVVALPAWEQSGSLAADG
jgi:hypothetical protein